MDEEVNKKGQMAVWVIIAIAFVASIILFFSVGDRRPEISTSQEFNIESYIQKCSEEHIDSATSIMLPQGGFLDPVNVKLYDSINVSYLCQNKGNYLPCVNQHPMLLNEMKEELKFYIEPRINECLVSLKRDVESREGSIDFSEGGIDILLGTDRVFLEINKKITISKNGETRTVDGVEVEVINPIYNLGVVANEIASQEAKYCYFEYVGYMALHPRFDIRKTTMSDGTKIYSIEDKHSEEEMNIAIRSCAVPPGI